MSVPEEVREAIIDGLVKSATEARDVINEIRGIKIDRPVSRSIFQKDADYILSALEAAGFEVNRKGTLEALGEAVAYADGVSWADGMPIDKQAKRLTFYCATDDGAEYEGVWDVSKARAMLTASRHKEKDDG